MTKRNTIRFAVGLTVAAALWGQTEAPSRPALWRAQSGAYSGSSEAETNPRAQAPAGTEARSVKAGGSRSADACAYTISQPTGPFAHSTGGAFRLRLLASDPGCAWAVEQTPPWLPVKAGTASKGAGTANIEFIAAPHPGGERRQGVVQIAGLQIIVLQNAPPVVAPSSVAGVFNNSTPTCSVVLTDGRNPTDESRLSASQQQLVLKLNGKMEDERTNCVWGEPPKDIQVLATDWIKRPAFKAGDQEVPLEVLANTFQEPRYGYVDLYFSNGKLSTTSPWQNKMITIVQAPGESCVRISTEASHDVPAEGGEKFWPVRQASGACQVTVPEYEAAGLDITHVDATPDGVRYRVAPTNSVTSRTARLSLPSGSGKVNLTVTQLGRACSFALNPRELQLPATDGTATVQIVASAAACQWGVGFGDRGGGSSTSGSSSIPPPGWMEILSARNGTGNGEFRFRYQRNESPGVRTATVALGNQSLTVTQEGINCTYSVSQSSRTLLPAGGSVEVPVETQPGCPWSATSDSEWLPIVAGSVNRGPGAVIARAAAIAPAESRQATLRIYSGTSKLEHSVSVTQTGVPCTYQVEGTAFSLPASGGPAVVKVTAPAACGWRVENVPFWLTGVAAGQKSGSQTLNFSATANASAQEREAQIKVAGVTVMIRQAGARSVKFTGDPAVITNCKDGLGRLTISWEAPGAALPVRVHVLTPTGPQPGEGGETGSFETGDWVINDTMFYLVDANNQVLATYKAIVQCGGPTTGGGDGPRGPGLVLTPNPLPACPTPKDPVRVEWNVAGQPPFKIFYRRPTSLSGTELLQTSSAKGNTSTSALMEDNTLFYITDANGVEAGRSYLRLDAACGARLNSSFITMTPGSTASPCTAPPERNSFLNTDHHAYYWFDLGGLPSNATARVEFRNPDGRLDQFTNIPLRGAARYCGSARLAIFSSPLPDDARPAGFTPGNWEARMVVNNTPIGSKLLRVDGPLRVITAYMRADVPNAPYDGNARTDFPISLKYTALYFTLKGMKAGDIVRAYFFQDGQPDQVIQWDPPLDDMDTWFVAWGETRNLLPAYASVSLWQVAVTIERQGVMTSLFPVSFRVLR